MHGSNCCQPNVPQRYDTCNPSFGGRETYPPKVRNTFQLSMFVLLIQNQNIMIYVCFCWHIHREIIRRKAVLALYKFYLIAPNQVQHIHNKFRKALCDKDPGVMTASLHIYLQMIKVLFFWWFHSCLLCNGFTTTVLGLC